MNISNKEQQRNIARLAGISYFAILGLVNLLATYYFATLHAIDFFTLFLCSLPLLLKSRGIFLQACGYLGTFISLYMGFAAVSFNANPAVATTQTAFNMGYLFIVSCLFASLALIFGGSRSAARIPAMVKN